MINYLIGIKFSLNSINSLVKHGFGGFSYKKCGVTDNNNNKNIKKNKSNKQNFANWKMKMLETEFRITFLGLVKN